ncbi:MAG TPA: copper chaperone PCu(A)C [Amaricoccus sp.]|nr:copper chaperone PCu(A)C [Amaricoccus sp.]
MLKPAVLAAALAAATTAAAAHDYTLGALEITHPRAIETSPRAMTGAGYLAITNTGATPDRLIAVRTDFPRAEIHAVETDAAGVSRMVHVEGLEIPPGETILLAPQGLHVMFMGLKQPLVAGQTVPATLEFEHAGSLAIDFDVEPRGAAAPHDMPAMKP